MYANQLPANIRITYTKLIATKSHTKYYTFIHNYTTIGRHLKPQNNPQ